MSGNYIPPNMASEITRLLAEEQADNLIEIHEESEESD